MPRITRLTALLLLPLAAAAAAQDDDAVEGDPLEATAEPAHATESDAEAGSEPTFVNAAGERVSGKVQHQQDRIGERVDSRVDEATDRAVDSVLDRALDQLFSR